MPGYDALHYDPPAPVAIVSLRQTGGADLVGNVPLLIDTGADITLLPHPPSFNSGLRFNRA